ncbi:MAG: hypothetical protein HY549_11140, partial [Elusimicrobia bacterium]|nr:hypothetical protein [Elusimicrobiota bacterium]
MPRAAALLILAAIPLAAEPPPRMSLSAAQAESLGAREAGLARTAIGRRLLAETRDIPRRAAALGELVRYERVPGPQLVFDLRRIEASEPFEFELALVRELAEAAAGAPA